MKTPYKGIVRIGCKATKCAKKLLQPVADCINCEHARVEILGLDDEVLIELKKQENKAPGSKVKDPTSKAETRNPKPGTRN